MATGTFLVIVIFIACIQRMALRQMNLDARHKMLVKHHESTLQLEYAHQLKVQKLREDQVRRQHESELTNQQDYLQRTLKEVKQKHILEQKQIPRNLKVAQVEKFNLRLSTVMFLY